MERVISIGERLQKLLEEAEMEAERKIAEARRKADEMIARAKDDAENRRIMAQRGDGIEDLLKAEEDKAKQEAAKILEEYRRRAEAVERVPREKIEEAISLVLREVLPK
ncbi:MAG: V-type ATPase subunit subunit G family protein [Candidatus Bathyarchaeia archaeon]